MHTHLGEKVTITGNIRVITFPRKDIVSYLYADTISYDSSQEVIITPYDKAAIEKLVQVTKRRKMNVLDILSSMLAPESCKLHHVLSCKLNELGRMYFEDQKHLLGVMQEQFFTINKHGINARIHSPTAIIASPIDGEWKYSERIHLDEIPAIKPLIDRFDLIFVIRNIRDEQWLRNYADRKLDLYSRKVLPNYTQYLRKYIEYSKRFDPILSEEAEHMLKEYYINVGLQYGSPRLLDSVTIIAKMIARLKLKNIIEQKTLVKHSSFTM